MSKKIITRERCMASLPSKMFSVSDLMNQRDGSLIPHTSKGFERNRELQQRQYQISKLKRNLQSAVTTAVNERLQSSKASRQYMFANQSKIFLTNKIANLQGVLVQKDKDIQKLKRFNQDLEKEVGTLKMQNQELNKKILDLNTEKMEVKTKLKQIFILNKKIQNLKNLQQRIKALEYQLRQQKLKLKQAQNKYSLLEKQKKALAQQLIAKKPYEEQLKQRILYLERVYLDLQRKQQDEHRRENQLIKEKDLLKNILAKITAERNHLKSNLEVTSDKLKGKTIECEQLIESLQQKNDELVKTNLLLNQQKDKTSDLQIQIKSTVQYYKTQTQDNIVMKKKIILIDQHNAEMKTTITHYLKISEEVNEFITNLTAQNHNLKVINKEISLQLEQELQRFQKFNIIFEPNTQRGKNFVKQSIYQLLRVKTKLQIQIKNLKQNQNEKFIRFGEQRDSLIKKIEIMTIPIPKQQISYDVLLYQKSQQILLLQNSNNQLIKVKKELSDRQQSLKKDLEIQKLQCYNLRLKATELFQTKKTLEKTLKINKRHQQKIEELKEKIQENKYDRQILRLKALASEDKSNKINLEKQNLCLEIKQLKDKIKSLDVNLLEGEKAKNKKNSLFLNDALDRASKGIKTLNYFFSCAFCGQIPINPVTIANCGHNFCEKCKQAYQQQCHECQNGQQIQQVFLNKYLKECTGKYKYLCIVIKQLQANFNKMQQNIG